MNPARRFWEWLRPRVYSAADDGVWALLVGYLLTQDRGDSSIGTIVGQTVALDVLQRYVVLGAAMSMGIELIALATGEGPTIGIGFVVVSLAALLRVRPAPPWATWHLVFMAVGSLVVVYVPWVLEWRSSAVLPGAARSVNTSLTLALVVGAIALRANFVGLLRRGEAAEERVAEASSRERARIARELHDVVAHQMTVVVAQAQGAEALVDQDPSRARAALRTISATTRDALVEMRRLVDVERAAPAPILAGAPGQPLPGISFDDLGRLATSAERAGLEVYMSISHDLDTPVSPGIALTAHRLIQESLTNAAKHAPGARVDVTTLEGADSLEISVVNGPPTAPPGHIPGAGVGLIGMQERVDFFGGTLETGPTPDGGWSVVARFPTLEAPSTSE